MDGCGIRTEAAGTRPGSKNKPFGNTTPMANFLRRLNKLEALLTDPSGLVRHSPKWFEHWNRQLGLYISGELQGVLFPAEIISGWIAQDSECGKGSDRCARTRATMTKQESRCRVHPPSHVTFQSPKREPIVTGVRSWRNLVSSSMAVTDLRGQRIHGSGVGCSRAGPRGRRLTRES
jgi:hypothetical protein